jgi:putative membrane protein
MMNNLCWGMGWGMWFIPLLIILLIYFLVKNNSQTKDEQGSESPMEILKKRYAKGEITKEQFEEMKKDIL